MTEMRPVHIIGLGLSPGDLTAERIKRIQHADILIGGRRLLDYFPDSAAEKKEIHKNIREIVAFIRHHLDGPSPRPSMVVLASGDPLFYGIGSLLARELGKENVVIHPNISSVAAAFAAIKESWQDAAIFSLHGREFTRDFFDAAASHDKIALFTDPIRHPGRIAEAMIQSGHTAFDMCVLEQLGSPAERIGWYSLTDAAGKTFSDPNMVILKRLPEGEKPPCPPLYTGMPESCFEHRQGLITKAEIRAVTLSKLRLHAGHHILWDLGAGSGSVSIEAARHITSGKIIAVEKNGDRIEHIKANAQRFGIGNLEIVQAKLPQGIENLPAPDRIFIGGGGSRLEEIIHAAAEKLRPKGVMVINTVLLDTITIALDTLKNEAFDTEIVQIQVSRGQSMPFSQRLEAMNPVWIISGVKPDKEVFQPCQTKPHHSR